MTQALFITANLLQVISPMDFLPFWPFILLLSLSAAVFYIRAVNVTGWNLIVRSTHNTRATSQLLREENIMESGLSGTLVFIFFLSFALLIQNIQSHTGLFMGLTKPILSYVLILLALFGIYISKVCILYFLQFVFQEREMFEEYITFFMNINIMLGVWLIPLNLIFIYGLGVSKSMVLGISITLTAMSYVLRYFRVYTMGMRLKIKWYNIILYLCTLEIMPIILMMALINNVGINLRLG